MKKATTLSKHSPSLLHEHTRTTNLPGLSYGEIAEALGISSIRVQQIEKRALKKLRDGLAKHGITSLAEP